MGEGEERGWYGDVQNTKREDEPNRDFLLRCHLDRPNHEDRHDGIHPIRDNSQHRDRVGSSDE